MENDAMKEAIKRKRGSGGYMIILGEPEISVQKLGEKGSDLAPEPEQNGDDSAANAPAPMVEDPAAKMSPEEKYKQMFGGEMADADKMQGPAKSLHERAAKEFAAKYKKS